MTRETDTVLVMQATSQARERLSLASTFLVRFVPEVTSLAGPTRYDDTDTWT